MSLAASGWIVGYASAPYDPRWAERHPKRAAVMALAGPAANLFLVLCAWLAIRIGAALGWLAPPMSIGFDRIVEAPGPGAAAIQLSGSLPQRWIPMRCNESPRPV